MLVEEELVIETGRRLAPQNPRDPRRQFDRIDQVLARHLVIDAERVPAHRPIRLPLQLAFAPGHRGNEFLMRFGIAPADRTGARVVRQHRRLHDDSGSRVNRQEGRIGRRPLLAQRRQHDRLHLVEAVERAQERLVEPARLISLGRGHEFVVEPELVEKGAQPRIVVSGEAVVFAERVGDLGQRLAEMGGDELAVRDVVGNLAQAVHVVGEGDQPGLDAVAG